MKKTATDQPLYESLAHQLKQQIQNQVWKTSEKLPSIRSTCQTSGLSLMTVLQAYQLLESQGWVYAKPKSGYFVLPQLLKLQEPTTLAVKPQTSTVDINDLLFDVLQNTKDSHLLPLGSAFPDPQLFPVRALARAQATGMRKLTPDALISNLPPGNELLRQIIAQRYFQQGIQISPEDIVITSGALESLNLSLQSVTEPGDLVAIESPCFYGALQAIERLKLKAVEIPTHPKAGIDLEVLAHTLESMPVKACWLMTNFQNPLGFCMSDERKKILVSVLDKYQVPLIEDDVYSELYFGQSKPLPAKAFEINHPIFHCSSFSKCLSPGFRVGWVAAGGGYARKIQKMQLMSTLSATVPSQLAVNEFLRHGGFDVHLRKLRRTLEQRQHQMLRAIELYLPSDVKTTKPQGGYFIWLEFPQKVNTVQLYQMMLAEGVSTAPGILFSSQKQYIHHLRINCSQPWSEQIEKAIKVMGRLVHILQG